MDTKSPPARNTRLSVENQADCRVLQLEAHRAAAHDESIEHCFLPAALNDHYQDKPETTKLISQRSDVHAMLVALEEALQLLAFVALGRGVELVGTLHKLGDAVEVACCCTAELDG